MKVLEISKFKAFKELLEIEISESNLLLYGENGAGKSSIFEAFKVIFFYERLENELPNVNTPEDFEEHKKNLWASFNNSNLNEDFTIKINGDDYRSFDKSAYQVSMISLSELQISGKINLVDLINKFYINIGLSAHEFSSIMFTTVEEEVNKSLANFGEDIKIKIDAQNYYDITFIDTNRKLERTGDIKKYFNEGKINLVVLLLLFTVINICSEKSKRKKLILDDFITSLDVSNRTFIYRYLIDNFSDFQILIFTHNISFFNLIKYLNNNAFNKVGVSWINMNLYEIYSKHKIYSKTDIEKVKDIIDIYSNINSNTTYDIEDIGNKVRKRFEIILNELSKILMLNGLEDYGKILDRICNSRSIFLQPDGRNVYDLIDEVDSLLTKNIPDHKIKKLLRDKINSYKLDLDNVKDILKNLKIYQKVTLHPLSHGSNGMPTFTLKEIGVSLSLLAKLEKCVEDLMETNVTSV